MSKNIGRFLTHPFVGFVFLAEGRLKIWGERGDELGLLNAKEKRRVVGAVAMFGPSPLLFVARAQATVMFHNVAYIFAFGAFEQKKLFFTQYRLEFLQIVFLDFALFAF